MTASHHPPPPWLTDGAPVVLWNSTRLGHEDPEAIVTTVKKVSRTSFSVEGEDTRIYLAGLRSTQKGSSWNTYRRVADTPDSPHAQLALARTNRARLKVTAKRATDDWLKDDNPGTLCAALLALTALAKADGVHPTGSEEA